MLLGLHVIYFVKVVPKFLLELKAFHSDYKFIWTIDHWVYAPSLQFLLDFCSPKSDDPTHSF